MRRRHYLRTLLAGSLFSFLPKNYGTAQPISISPAVLEQRRNRRMIPERAVGDNPEPIPVALESGGQLTRLDQPTVFFLLKAPVVADIEFRLLRSGDQRQVYKGSIGVKWSRGLHPVHFADTQVHLEPGVPFDWTLTLRSLGHEPADSGATIMHQPPAPGFAEQLAKLPPNAAVDTLQRANYWYDAFLWSMQSPPDIRGELVRKLLVQANIRVT